ncbi:MAG: hypothetical protein Q8Q09_29065 [Deltaproteobacteria bacterium]|nr:hypothetical protein [Deltaproteobacteria bacterium]
MRQGDPVVEGTAGVIVADVAQVPGHGAYVSTDHLALSLDFSAIRFSVASLQTRSIERVVLLLWPDPSWQTENGSVAIQVHVASAGSSSLHAPLVAAESIVQAVVSRSARIPVRLDVTAAARRWIDEQSADGVLLLSADQPGIVFAGTDGVESARRPRLEVVYR